MKIHVVSVGSLKSGPLRVLWETYERRLMNPLEIHDVLVSKTANKSQEATLILKEIPPQSFVVALDERGENLPTRSFADLLEKRRTLSTKHMCFIIGGADGLDLFVREKADKILSFGAQTWPHDFVHVLLIEQLYRAQQILRGHPYHRGS